MTGPGRAPGRSVGRTRGRAPGRVPGRGTTPTLRRERELLRAGHRWVAGMDEVGRGALAGPVSVGVVVIGTTTRTAPTGVRDSKLLTPAARVALAPRLRRWAVASAVGHAQAEEIDAHGIIAALRLAGRRALAALEQPPDVVLLDGSHDWLGPPRVPGDGAGAPGDGGCGGAAGGAAGGAQGTLFDVPTIVLPGVGRRSPAPHVPLAGEPTVTTMVKADLRCAAVAAASVLAKVERDALMVDLAGENPLYGWEENKGYSAPDHLEALRVHGPCEWHRRSWNLKAGVPVAAD